MTATPTNEDSTAATFRSKVNFMKFWKPENAPSVSLLCMLHVLTRRKGILTLVYLIFRFVIPYVLCTGVAIALYLATTVANLPPILDFGRIVTT
jgi:hypothetical protein